MKISFIYIAAWVCAHQLLLTSVMALSVGIELPGQSRAPSAPGSAVTAAAAAREGDKAAEAAAFADAQAQAAQEAAAANAAANAAQAYAKSKAPRPSPGPPAPLAPVLEPGSASRTGKRSSISLLIPQA